METFRQRKSFLLSLPSSLEKHGLNEEIVVKAFEACKGIPSLIDGVITRVLEFLPTTTLKNHRNIFMILLDHCDAGIEAIKPKGDDISSLVLESLLLHRKQLTSFLGEELPSLSFPQTPFRGTFFGRRPPRRLGL